MLSIEELKSKNPIKDVYAWLNFQPPAIIETISLIIAPHLVGELDDSFLLEGGAVLAFKSWISEKASMTNEMGTVATFLIIKSIVKFFIINHFCTRDGWRGVIDNNKEIYDSLLKQGHGEAMIAPLVKIDTEAEFTGKQWERVGESWWVQIEKIWSDEELRQWMTANAPDYE